MADVLKHTADDSPSDRSRRGGPAPRAGRLTPRSVTALRLQRSAGNKAVAGLLARDVVVQPLTVAPFRTKQQWVADTTVSSGLIKKKAKRLEGLEKIDAAVGVYEAFGDLDEHMKKESYDDGVNAKARQLLADRNSALSDIKDAIGGWRRARKEGAKGWTQVDALAKEVDDERKKVLAVIDRWEDAARKAKIEARGQQMDPLIPKDLNAKQGVDAKARELFRIFMQFRGQVRYRTTSKSEFWDTRAGPMACATFANGFRDFVRRAGLEAQTVPITVSNFITAPIGDTFIDAESNGNLSTPTASLAQTRRFFFSEHHVVAVQGGPHFCPTSGHVTDAAGTSIVDPNPDYRNFVIAGAGAYENDRYTVSKIGEIPEGSHYQLKPKAGK